MLSRRAVPPDVGVVAKCQLSQVTAVRVDDHEESADILGGNSSVLSLMSFASHMVHKLSLTRLGLWRDMRKYVLSTIPQERMDATGTDGCNRWGSFALKKCVTGTNGFMPRKKRMIA